LPSTSIYTLSLHDALPISYVTTYDQDGGHYLRTVLVAQGSPAGQFSSGLFQDKINLAVDQTNGSNSGNVYLAWSRYSGRAGNNVDRKSTRLNSSHQIISYD